MLLPFLKARGKGNERSFLSTLLRVGRQGCGLAFLGINGAAFCWALSSCQAKWNTLLQGRQNSFRLCRAAPEVVLNAIIESFLLIKCW